MRSVVPWTLLLLAACATQPNDADVDDAPPPGRYVGAWIETLGAT